MNQLTYAGFNPAFSCGSAHGIAVLSGPRELTEEEIEMVSGGIAPVLILGARIAGAAFATGFGTTMGIAVANAIVNAATSVWGEEEQACR